jgi:hypothetical protein
MHRSHQPKRGRDFISYVKKQWGKLKLFIRFGTNIWFQLGHPVSPPGVGGEPGPKNILGGSQGPANE